MEPYGDSTNGFVKSPSAVLCFFLRHCGVLTCTPHSSEFARLADGAFHFAVKKDTFYETIRFK